MIFRELFAQQHANPPRSVLSEAQTRLERVSEKYGRRELGCLGGIKCKVFSWRRRRSRCTEALWGCRGEIDNASTKLRVSSKIPVLGLA